MTDNELISILATVMDKASAAAGWNYPVVQANEPRVAANSDSPTIYFTKVGTYDYGFPIEKDVYNEGTGLFDSTSQQIKQDTFQIYAIVPQNPEDLTIPTTSDVVQYVKMYFHARSVAASLQKQGVGILRVTDVRNPYFSNDREQYESNANFDIVVSYSRSITLQTPKLNAFEVKDYPV